MPRPLSAISKIAKPSLVRPRTVISPGTPVLRYLSALSIRLEKICSSARRSLTIFGSASILIAAVVETVAHQAAEAQARIQIDSLPDIVSDRLALEQIFSNLIDNALKYLKTGVPGEISVRGRTKLGFAIFEISDNGRGIDPKDHQRIFELFRRAGTQDRPGQGIGLAHVRALVRRLGGTMSVSSELGQGSSFTVTLPINWNANNRNTPA